MRAGKNNIIDPNNKSITLTISLIVLIGIFCLTTGIFAYNYSYQDKVYIGVKTNYHDLSGKNKTELLQVINDLYTNYEQKGIKVNYNNQVTNLLDYKDEGNKIKIKDLIYINDAQFVKTALNTGRNQGLSQNITKQVFLFSNNENIPIQLEINETLLKHILQKSYSEYSQEPIDSQLTIKDDLSFELSESKDGFIFDYYVTINDITRVLNDNTDEIIELKIFPTDASIKPDNSQAALEKLETILAKNSYQVTALEHEWELTPHTIKDWVTLNYDVPTQVVTLAYKNNKIEEYINSLATEINIEAQDAVFTVENNRVTEFSKEKYGQKLASEKNIEIIINNINDITNPIELIIYESKPKILLADINTYNIIEVIGVGTSNFAGSPYNRRHNIAVGASSLHGLLIAPEEEFSLITSLGEINAAGGYKTELVIRDNKTIPEYGGGLCQIGTTTFRTALASGLPITQRRNHSYRVRYYEPAGTDATIYDPWPDFRFSNDTGNYLMIQTYIDGDEIYFEFWGKKDGRIIEQTTPKIWGISAPPPTKLIETTDLEPGKKVCTEHAVYGAKASFTYTVTYPEIEEPVITEFNSTYRPWQEVCLIGVEELSCEDSECIHDPDAKNDDPENNDDTATENPEKPNENNPEDNPEEPNETTDDNTLNTENNEPVETIFPDILFEEPNPTETEKEIDPNIPSFLQM